MTDNIITMDQFIPELKGSIGFDETPLEMVRRHNSEKVIKLFNFVLELLRKGEIPMNTTIEAPHDNPEILDDPEIYGWFISTIPYQDKTRRLIESYAKTLEIDGLTFLKNRSEEGAIEIYIDPSEKNPWPTHDLVECENR